MKRKIPTTGILAAAFVVMLVLVFRERPTEHGGPSIQPQNVSSASDQRSENEDGLIVVEDVGLSSEELRELEELFEPLEDNRRMTEVVQLGQSVLCDVLTYDDGRVAFTFITPQLMTAESGEAMLIFKSGTSMLHLDGSLDILTSPTVITKENQSAKISIGREDRTSYSMQFSGILIGGDALALSAEMTGDPAMLQPRR